MSKLINLYKNISTDIWDRMAFFHNNKLSLTETTMTENLLYEIYKYKHKYANKSIDIEQAIDEKTNGNDLEVYVEVTKGRYLFFPTQAKKLYINKKEKYESINHRVGVAGPFQIDLLLNYAYTSPKGGIPMYLFYNYVPKFLPKNKKRYGCTLTCALYIKKSFAPAPPHKLRWTIPTFKALHHQLHKYSKALPLLSLVRIKDLLHFVKTQDCIFDKGISYYSNEDLISDAWGPIVDIESKTSEVEVPKAERSKKRSKELSKEDGIQNISFRPKYRIIFNLE